MVPRGYSALDVLSEQDWRNVGIVVYASMLRAYERERSIDRYLATGSRPGHPSACGACKPENRSRPGVVWSTIPWGALL